MAGRTTWYENYGGNKLAIEIDSSIWLVRGTLRTTYLSIFVAGETMNDELIHHSSAFGIGIGIGIGSPPSTIHPAVGSGITSPKH
jgi:hypothetical protein